MVCKVIMSVLHLDFHDFPERLWDPRSHCFLLQIKCLIKNFTLVFFLSKPFWSFLLKQWNLAHRLKLLHQALRNMFSSQDKTYREVHAAWRLTLVYEVSEYSLVYALLFIFVFDCCSVRCSQESDTTMQPYFYCCFYFGIGHRTPVVNQLVANWKKIRDGSKIHEEINEKLILLGMRSWGSGKQ